MYLVVIDEEFGIVAAPEHIGDITGEAVDLFRFFGLHWNDEQEMFAVEVSDDAEASALAVTLLINLEITGHEVIGIAVKG
jgi:hypothetical protein